jgi:hypothetical protein
VNVQIVGHQLWSTCRHRMWQLHASSATSPQWFCHTQTISSAFPKNVLVSMCKWQASGGSRGGSLEASDHGGHSTGPWHLNHWFRIITLWKSCTLFAKWGTAPSIGLKSYSLLSRGTASSLLVRTVYKRAKHCCHCDINLHGMHPVI